MQKGQVAIEFIFILLIIIIYVFTVTIPLIESAQDAILDIDRITRAKHETEKINQAIRQIYFLDSGSRQTVNVFIPNHSSINCYENENKIGFTSQINLNEINPEITICPSNICEYKKEPFSNLTIICSQENFFTGNYKISIEKKNENEIEIIMVS